MPGFRFLANSYIKLDDGRTYWLEDQFWVLCYKMEDEKDKWITVRVEGVMSDKYKRVLKKSIVSYGGND